MHVKRVLWHALAVLVGLLPGFFFVFAGVFTDPGGLDERAVSLGLVVGSYALLGALLARFVPGVGWTVGLSLASSAVVILVLYTTREPQNVGLHAAYLATTLGGALGGSWVGAWVRRRAGPRVSRPPT